VKLKVDTGLQTPTTTVFYCTTTVFSHHVFLFLTLILINRACDKLLEECHAICYAWIVTCSITLPTKSSDSAG